MSEQGANVSDAGEQSSSAKTGTQPLTSTQRSERELGQDARRAPASYSPTMMSAPARLRIRDDDEESEYVERPLGPSDVRYAVDAAKREILAQTKTMLSQAKTEILEVTVGPGVLDRQEDEIALIKQAVVETNEKLDQLADKLDSVESKVNLLLKTRSHRSRSPNLQKPEGVKDGRRNSTVRAQRDRSPALSERSNGAMSDRSEYSVREKLARDDRQGREELVTAKGPDGFTPRPQQTWKGPKAEGLSEIDPSDPRFATVLSYRCYRLRNTDPSRGPEVERDTGVFARRMSHTMSPLIFDGSKPIAILQFLRTLKRELDGNGRSEGAALLLCPKFLIGDALETYNTQFDLANDGLGGFQAWPEAVQFLLRTYAKDAYIEEALQELDECVQGSEETEEVFAKRLRSQTRQMAGVFSQQDLITRYLRGCHPSLKPVLRHTRRMYTGPNAFQDFIEHAIAQGEANRALLRGNRPSSTVKPAPRRRVLAVESKYDDGQEFRIDRVGENRDTVNMVTKDVARDEVSPTESIEYSHPTSDAYHTAQGSPSPAGRFGNDVNWVGQDRGRQVFRGRPPAEPRRHYRDAPPPPAVNRTNVDKNARPVADVRWGNKPYEKSKDDICYDCFEVGHRRPECPFTGAVRDKFFDNFVRRNYVGLTADQRSWLDRMGHTPEFARRLEEGGTRPEDSDNIRRNVDKDGRQERLAASDQSKND